MVQRKVTNKLGIQADQVKANEQLVNLITPFSPSFQHHDSRKIIVGADSKKKMKKSRATKRSDHHVGRLGSGIRHLPQPGKPPPEKPATEASSSPQKKSAAKQQISDEAMPNYMKPTSSSGARKEQIRLVSSKNVQILSDGKISSVQKLKNRANMNSSSVSTKGARKLVRTLTKTTSFKPARSSSVVTKGCCPGVLSENLNSQKATCSFTLKDSKFPAYLELNSGGTESEGNSVMKVCPYTYCSLNGHHHPPLPPLKSFLSSRRLMLKAQRSIRLGCGTSPRLGKPKKVLAEQLEFDEPSRDEEKQVDFFVEIYSKEKQGAAEITEFVNNVKPLVVETSYDIGKEVALPGNQHILEILPGESPFSKVDSTEDNNEPRLVISTKIEDAEYNEEGSLGKEDNRKGDPIFHIGELTSMRYLSWSQDEVEGRKIIPIDSNKSNFSEPDRNTVALQNSQDMDLHEVPIQFGSCVSPCSWIHKADITMIQFLEGFQDDGTLQQSFDEEMFDGQSIISKADSDHNFEIQDYTGVSEAQSNSQMQGSEDDGLPEECGITCLIFLEEHNEELSPTDCDVHRKSLQGDDAAEEIWDLESQDFHDMIDQSSKAGCNASSDREDDEEKEQGGVFESYRKQKCTSQVDDFEATKNHLEPLNGRSDESFAGEEPSPISMSIYDTSGAIDNSHQESPEPCSKLKWRTGGKQYLEESKGPKEFNPRGPNFLPMEPDPEAEKVDLKHQTIDERKSADEWMLDYAIQQAVTKLGPARKKKVALLVEAFETVIPPP